MEPLLPPTTYPELDWSVDALLAIAVRERLGADAALLSVFLSPGAGGILTCDRRALLSISTLSPPLLAVTIRAHEEILRTSSHGAVFKTLLELFLLTSAPRDISLEPDFLRSRLVRRITAVLFAEGGEIVDGRGRCLAKATAEVQRVDFDEASLPSGLVPTVLRVGYETDIDHWTQEIDE